MYQHNVFLRELSKLLKLGNICTLSINNKTEFISLMKYLGFRIRQRIQTE